MKFKKMLSLTFVTALLLAVTISLSSCGLALGALSIGGLQYLSDPFNYDLSNGGKVITGVKDKSISEAIIPEDVTGIGNYAFDSCTNLTDISLPDGVTGIGDSAFAGCTNLRSVDIPDTVTKIGASAFFECRSLTCVSVPDGVATIEGYTFARCVSLEQVTIPKSVTSMGIYAFDGCNGLMTINYAGTEEQWNAIDKSLACIPAGVTVNYNYIAE